MRTFHELPRGRTDTGLLGDGESRGFEEAFFVGEREVGRGEFDEPGRHAFLRDEGGTGKIASEPKLRLGARTSGAPADDKFGKEIGLFRFKKGLGGGAERREGNTLFCGRRRAFGFVGQRARRTASDEGESVERGGGFARNTGLMECPIHEPKAVAVGNAFRKKPGKPRRTISRCGIRIPGVGKRKRGKGSGCFCEGREVVPVVAEDDVAVTFFYASDRHAAAVLKGSKHQQGLFHNVSPTVTGRSG